MWAQCSTCTVGAQQTKALPRGHAQAQVVHSNLRTTRQNMGSSLGDNNIEYEEEHH